MALTNTIVSKTVFGNKRIRYGTFTKTYAGTNEEFNTGLKRVDYFDLQITGSGTGEANRYRISSGTAFPLNTGIVGVYFESGTFTGIWKADGN